MQNYNDILNGVTDGSKDLSISALTVAGTATLNGNINLGNASADDLTIAASLASSLPIKTNNSFDVGSATLGLRKLYLGNAGAGATCDIVSASHATTREYTIPDAGAAANFVMSEATATINGIKTFATQLIGKGTTANDSASAGYIGEYIESNVTSDTSTPASGAFGDATTITLTAGDWDVSGCVWFLRNGATYTVADFLALVLGVAGDSQTGTVYGANGVENQGVAGLTFTQFGICTPVVRVTSDGTNLYNMGTTTSSSQVIRLKLYPGTYSAGTPKYRCGFRARRVR